MLRKRIELLSVKDGRYSYGGEPYSGVGFESGEGRSVNAILMEKGEIVSPYQSPYFPAAERPEQIDISGFTESSVADDENAELSNGDDLEYLLAGGYYDLLVRGKAYSGLAYEFQDGTCVAEFGYRGGRLVSKARWSLAGSPRFLYLDGDLIQSYEWHSSGTLRSATIEAGGNTSDSVVTAPVRGVFGFYDNGSIKLLSMTKAFVSFLERDASRMIHRPIEKVEDVGSFKGGETFTLWGDGVDDRVFGAMFHGGVFDTTSELRVFRTLVSDSSANLEALSNNKIKKLTFDSNSNLGAEFVDRLRHRRPDIQIEIRSP